MEIHDGDGLRTTVFFKGCPLKCVWCHNPESISFGKQIAFFKDKCIGCDSCLEACNEGVFAKRTPPFAACSFCEECTKACPTNALVRYGKAYSADELIEKVLQDEEYFKNGQGGVTLSGGECLCQPAFAIEVAKRLHGRGLSVNIDTCGFVKREVFEKILPYADTFLYDIKAIDEALHTRLTGQSNAMILENLRYLSSVGAKIEIRYPLIMGYNDCEAEKIASFLKTLHIQRVKILQYHRFAASRYEALGMENTLPDTQTSLADIDRCAELFRA